jgi:hypothetical protein
MESLILQAFSHIDNLGQMVQDGHYDLIGPDNEIILPQIWETMVKPDMAIQMQMWPVPEKKKAPMPQHLGFPPGMDYHTLLGHAPLSKKDKEARKKEKEREKKIRSQMQMPPGMGMGGMMPPPPPPLGTLLGGMMPPPPPPGGLPLGVMEIPAKKKSSKDKKKGSSSSSSSKGILGWMSGSAPPKKESSKKKK